jgi:uncharacterized alkaline shock family protein YloU
MTDTTRTPGKTTIAPEVLLTIARLTTLNVNGVSRLAPVPGGVKGFFKRNQAPGVHIDIVEDTVNAEIHVILESDMNVRQVSHRIQSEVSRAISEMVGMQVGQINIHIEDIDYPVEGESEA